MASTWYGHCTPLYQSCVSVPMRDTHVSAEETLLNLAWGVTVRVASSSGSFPRASSLFFLPANGQSPLTLYSTGNL